MRIKCKMLSNYIRFFLRRRFISTKQIYKKNHTYNTKHTMLDCFSLHKLHTTYCMSLYGCEIWNYNSRFINEMFIAWRKIMRKLFKLPNRTHNYIVCGIVECISFKLDRRLA